MRSGNYILWITILWFGSTTLFSQAPDSAKICLYPIELKYYIGKVYEVNALKNDTGRLNYIVKKLEEKVINNELMLKNDSSMLAQQDTIASKVLKAYTQESADHQKTKKKLTKSQNWNLILGTAAGVLAVILAIVSI